MKVYLLIPSKILIILCALLLSSNLYADPSDEAIVRELDTHWQSLINEQDETTRNRMIQEHQKMMNDAKNKLGITSHHGSHSGGHHHLMNTFNMHESIMEMIQ